MLPLLQIMLVLTQLSSTAALQHQADLLTWPWGGQDALVHGRVRLEGTGTGWAFKSTRILDARTGVLLGDSKGDMTSVGSDFFDLQCGPTDAPYCQGARLIVVDRVNFRKATVQQRKFELPAVPNCTYRYGYVNTITRHGPRYLDYLIEASCGYVFARYDWAGTSNLPVRTQVLKSKTWPLPYPK